MPSTRITKTYDPSNYKDLEILGKGSYGMVYRAYDNKLDKTIVMKKIVKNQTREKTILNEVGILSHLKELCQDHILCYVDFMEDDDNFYIFTEYLGEYITLTDFIEKHKMKADDYVTLIENLKDGLIEIHKLGVSHRDIKPDNIMINPNNLKIKYIDFGLSCHLESCYETNGVGTPMYMAPELLISGYDQTKIPRRLFDWFKADYWSLGMIILELGMRQPFLEYFMMKLMERDNPEEELSMADVTNAGLILLESGFSKELMVFYCKNFLPPKSKLDYYYINAVLPLLQKKPNDRMLIKLVMMEGRSFLKPIDTLLTF